MTNKPIWPVKTDKNIVIQTTHGQVHVNEDFNFEQNQPLPGIVKITDKKNNKIYWFNSDRIVWIGPRK